MIIRSLCLLFSLRVALYDQNEACYAGIGDFRPFHIIRNSTTGERKLEFANPVSENITLEFFEANMDDAGLKLFVNVSWRLQVCALTYIALNTILVIECIFDIFFKGNKGFLLKFH